MKDKQMSLFASPKNKKKDKETMHTPRKIQAEHEDTKPVSTKADDAYTKLERNGYIGRTHIYSQSACASIILDYANGNCSCLGEDLEAMCKRFKQTKRGIYYHVKNGHFIPYDAWLINMVDDSLKKTR